VPLHEKVAAKQKSFSTHNYKSKLDYLLYTHNSHPLYVELWISTINRLTLTAHPIHVFV